MLVTALGLSMWQNFLALPIAVFGIWKFGFPETLMYLYLGLFCKAKSMRRRAADLLDGLGTLIHHSSAALILSMLLVGVIPPSRYVLNCALVLTMQHWVALVSYWSTSVYVGLALVIEYYFEWIIFCKCGKEYGQLCLTSSLRLFLRITFLTILAFVIFICSGFCSYLSCALDKCMGSGSHGTSPLDLFDSCGCPRVIRFGWG